MRMYRELVDFYSLLTPLEDYEVEAAWLRERLPEGGSLLELGCGAGHLAHWLGDRERVLTDLSEAMLDLSRALNPEAEHVQGDMRHLRLGRTFDGVLVQDAVAYMLSEADLRAVFATAAAHLRPGGQLFVLPDVVAERFEEAHDQGFREAPDGRALLWQEWMVADPADPARYHVHYSFLARHPDGRVEAHADHHVEGLFPEATWRRLLEEAGFAVTVAEDDWDRLVFMGVLRAAAPALGG